MATEVLEAFFAVFLLSGKVILTTDKPECEGIILTDEFLDEWLDDVDEPEIIERCESGN